MSKVKRIYVEKKTPYAVRAKELKSELRSYLGIKGLEAVRVLIRYDIENVSETTYKKSLGTVFSEPPIDVLCEENFESNEADRSFAVEFLPGQFDQRADSAEQCVKLLDEKELPVIRSATTYVLTGNISDEEFDKMQIIGTNFENLTLSILEPDTSYMEWFYVSGADKSVAVIADDAKEGKASSACNSSKLH